MPELSLLDINPDKLFEQHNVQEVEAIERAINNEVERKKVELRTLVGERYRDLIEAADTIGEMKNLSEEVIQDIDAMMVEMVTLQKKHQQPYKPNVYLKENSITPSITDSIAAQVATMLEFPEQIWSEITSKEYIKAAQLFLFARHIKTGFTVEKSLQEYAAQIPVLEHQWSIILHFKDVILESANKDLKTINISPKNAGTCLACIALLEDTPLVTKFLQLRTEAVNDILHEENNVKDGIINSCLCIVNTLTVLQHCFLGTNDVPRGLLWEILNSVTSSNNKPIYLLEPSIKLKYLPQVVLQFSITQKTIGRKMLKLRIMTEL
ncbi:hypothetical protein O3M35_007564 [Rhynocoris fuscipes]|uniref:Conserved oligomeric Golgi complex subunit 1 n=1 Tax=Rhynocoris fuscipes TaxID=488301 RepID=A0AAW1DBA5_9HEMI